MNAGSNGILDEWPAAAKDYVERSGVSGFATGKVQMSVRKALTFAFLDRYASLIIGIGASVILARLRTPADVAVFSIATVLLGFLSSVRDLGTGQYLVREKELDSERARAVWTGNSAIYCSMLVLALAYVINPFGSLTNVWLMREMCYSCGLREAKSTMNGRRR